MYEPNYKFFFKSKNIRFAYILLFLIISFFLFNFSYAVEQEVTTSQDMDSMQGSSLDTTNDSNFNLDDDELPESDITTKIYKSTDSSNEVLDRAELDPALDTDLINKEDLISMNSYLKKKIIHREKLKNRDIPNKSFDNSYLPWILFAIILLLLIVLIKVIKLIKI